jgi:hypothetical protein
MKKKIPAVPTMPRSCKKVAPINTEVRIQVKIPYR